MKLWIPHPAVSEPVSFRRWVLFHLGDWLERRGRRMVHRALYPYGDEIPF